VTALLTRLTTRLVDIRHRPGLGTVYSRVNRVTGAREVLVRLADQHQDDALVLVPADRVRLLDGCWSAAEVRALLAGAR
jgi:hypothetical protein